MIRRWILIGIVVCSGTALGVAVLTRHGRIPHSEPRVPHSRYHCPMHPSYVSDRPGQCPICHMDLVPVEAEPSSGSDAAAGRAPVSIPAGREQLIGVRTARVEEREMEAVVRAGGRVAQDPELYSALAEYKEALSVRGQASSAVPETRKRADALAEASFLRLRRMGLSGEQIKKMAAGPAPANLLAGQAGKPVWVYAEIYEHESGLVKPGQRMEVTSAAFPGRRFAGRVAAVDTSLDPETRTLKVRAEIPDPDGLLKPEMFVDVVIRAALGRRLAVPEEAVLETGARRLVFVQAAPGRYEPREISTGAEGEDAVEVVSGLKEGEIVATSASFLLDSESRLKAAISEMGGPSGDSTTAPAPSEGHRH